MGREFVRDHDVRAKAVYALAERRGRRERQGQAKPVIAAMETLRRVAGLESRGRAQRQTSERT